MFLKCVRFFFLSALFLLSHGLLCVAQNKDEVNFKVGQGVSAKDVNVHDSIFFSLEEARKHPSRVSELSLEGKGLRQFPEIILTFKNLRVLNISQNRIDSIPARLFTLCKKLTVLQYAGNQLNTISSVLFQPTLKVLDLSENNLTMLPDGIMACRHLEELDLHANRLLSYPSQTVVLKSLKSLILSGNPLTAWSTWILNQPQLKILFIDNTLIENLTEELCKMNALRFLNIEENNIKELPSCFCNLKDLKVLMISGSALSKETLEEVNACLPDLQMR